MSHYLTSQHCFNLVIHYCRVCFDLLNRAISNIQINAKKMQPVGSPSNNIPAFLGKLWKMVNDPNTDQLISWSSSGNSFMILNQAQFWYELLPVYYKHNNMSSFVRQLNMYGFHKMSSVDNGTMDPDKDEIQFYHPFFQKNKPDLLKDIKRKVTATKGSESNENSLLKKDDLTKVLTDVKFLRGRQTSVDSQLSAMKQENAVLWRELAILRQKHIKQQQIVNKLIQFLVTMVQPSTTRMGVKRRMPLMLHDHPTKKAKQKAAEKAQKGLTIHELDNEIELNPEELLEEPAEPIVNSPQTSTSGNGEMSHEPAVDLSDGSDIWIQNEEIPDDSIFVENDDAFNSPKESTKEIVYMNDNSEDEFLNNLTSGVYNGAALNGKSQSVEKTNNNDMNSYEQTSAPVDYDMTIAMKNPASIINSGTLGTNDGYRDDLDLHLESTQNELEQLKDILNGCSTFDANALLALFNSEGPGYGLPYIDDLEKSTDTGVDPLVSGSELVAFEPSLIDFNELIDESFNYPECGDSSTNKLANIQAQPSADSSTINTPLILKSEPIFPKYN